MTATEVLRRLLDERGVEWDADDEAMDDGSLSQVTYWYCNGIEWSADGRDEYLAFDAVQLLSPEQAVAATLGSCNCTNGERTDLPHFWTHDGTLHVELPKLPESISVRLTAQRDREAGSARVWQYALGNGGVGRTNDGLADLQAENAELRELCEDMLDCIEIRAAWHRPPTEEMCEEFAQRARELGVEVDA